MHFFQHSRSASPVGAGQARRSIGSAQAWLRLLALAVVWACSLLAVMAQSSPSPQSVGRETVSLNGTWKIAFDTGNTGKADHWYEHFPAETTPIRVPSVWNEIRPNYQGVAWYQTSFAAPARWKGSSVHLGFGAVSYLAEVWLNGKYLGTHEGGYTPFEFEVGDSLIYDQQNQLIIRVLLPMRSPDFMSGLKWVTGKRIDGYILEEIPASKQIWYDNFGGIWQDVKIQVTARTWLQDCFIRPNIYAEKIDATCDVTNRTGSDQKLTLDLAATEKRKPADEVPHASKDVTVAAGGQSFDVSLNIPGAKLWSPEHPLLYTLKVRLLANGNPIDSRQFTFGMREFTIREHRFYLNGQPIILKAAIYQPHYPETLAYPPNPDMLATDIRLAKEAHFNMLRLHIKPQVPRLLELADEQGILLYEEPPIGWIQKSPEMRERCRREVRELITRDRNHPALVMWGALNEGADAGEELKSELAAYAHELDPTRLVFDDSGGVYYSGENSRVYIPGDTVSRPINDIHPYMLQPFSSASLNFYRQMQEPNLLNFTSEFGAMGGIEDLDAVIAKYSTGHDWQDKDRLVEIYGLFRKGFDDLGLGKSFGDFAGFAKSSRDAQAEALSRMIDALRVNPLTAGYDICHWNDASFELAFGLLDEWRNPKPSYFAAAAENKPLHAILSTVRSNFYSGEPLEANLTLVNDEGQSGNAQIMLEVATEDGKVLQKQIRAVALGPRVQSIGHVLLAAPIPEGSYRLNAVMSVDGKLVDRTEQRILVLKRSNSRAEAMEVGALDPGGRLAGELKNLPIKVTAYGADAPAQSVYLVGPLADSLYDYPLAQLKSLVELARQGATLVLFELPMDTGAVSEKFSVFPSPLKVDFPEGFKLQWIKSHAITEGLPSNLVLNQTYSEVLPARYLDMSADEVVGGMLLDSFGDYHHRWFHSLVVKNAGQGHIIICQYRLLENLGKDPLADRMLMNLLGYAQSIAHQPGAPLGHDKETALDQEVSAQQTKVGNELQRWAIAGPFDNRGRAGLGHAYPPEKEFGLNMVYIGKNGSVPWKPATVWSADGYRVNLGMRFDEWTVQYAYTRLYSPQDADTQFKLTCQQGCRLWLGGREIVDSSVAATNENTVVPVHLHAGWTPILVKVDRTKMQKSFFMLDVKNQNGAAMPDLRFDFAQ